MWLGCACRSVANIASTAHLRGPYSSTTDTNLAGNSMGMVLVQKYSRTLKVYLGKTAGIHFLRFLNNKVPTPAEDRARMQDGIWIQDPSNLKPLSHEARTKPIQNMWRTSTVWGCGPPPMFGPIRPNQAKLACLACGVGSAGFEVEQVWV